MTRSRRTSYFYTYAPLYLSVALTAQATYFALATSLILSPILSLVGAFLLLISHFTPGQPRTTGWHRPMLAISLAAIFILQLLDAHNDPLILYTTPLVPPALLLLCKGWRVQIVNTCFLAAFTLLLLLPPPHMAQLLASNGGHLLFPLATLLNWFVATLFWLELRRMPCSEYYAPRTQESTGDRTGISVPAVDISPENVACMHSELMHTGVESLEENRTPEENPNPIVLTSGPMEPFVFGLLAENEFNSLFAKYGIQPTVSVTLDAKAPKVVEGDPLLVRLTMRKVIQEYLTDDLKAGLPIQLITTLLGIKDDHLVLRAEIATGTASFTTGRPFDPAQRLDSPEAVWNTVRVQRTAHGVAVSFEVPLWPYSELGHGCDPKTGPVAESTRPIDFAPLANMRVLLAEDNAINQRIMQATLSNYVGKLQVANNRAEAVSLVNSQHFDLVLMDVQMPELDGIEATKRIRAMEKGTGQHLPIIAMTSYAMQCDRQTCIAAGMDYYLSKPFDNRSLLNLMLTAGKTPNQ